MSNVVIITAAGQGRRMGQPKQFLEIAGQTIVERTIAVFEQTKVVDEIILVVNAEDVERSKQFKYSKLKQVVAGGKKRQNSVRNGMQVLPEDCEMVLIHDGARPLVSSDLIESSIVAAKKSGAVVVGVPVKDTIKQIRSTKLEIRNNDQTTNVQIQNTLDRDTLWQAQTPPVFKKEIIVQAYDKIKGEFTDDAMLVEQMGQSVVMIMGSYENIKITTPEDLLIAQTIIQGREK